MKTVLHLYYKLDYIKLTWGGAKEQEEHENGNPDAKNWQDEAHKILETMVRLIFIIYDINMNRIQDRKILLTVAKNNDCPENSNTIISKYH